MSTFNFNGLQQKADQTLHNADEFVRKWQEFIAAPAGNVNLEYYDRNGNLKTVSFSNRNKLIQDFITNVNSAMNKTFYVDAVNGNNNNDGSSTAPFKTIKKAVDSVPSGGKAIIYTIGTVQVDNDINRVVVENKLIFFFSYNSTSKIIWNRNNGDALFIRNSSVVFRCDCDFNNNQDTTLRRIVILDSNSSLMFTNRSDGTNAVYNIGSNVTINASYGSQLIYRVCEVNIPTGSYLCDVQHNAILSFEKGTVLLNGTTPTNTDVASYVRNIVRDANGVPRNIVSNIVL